MTIHQALVFYFGHDHFRLHQEDIINQIMAGHDVCAILPTGAGKSLCYQLPALLLSGTTLVISPLISLMRDQVLQLQNRSILAEALTSGQTTDFQTEIYKKLENNQLKLLYVSPERLTQSKFLLCCQKFKINLVVVDEAHCISQWGHDFRPEYRQIHQFISILAQRPTLVAFTASATQKVATDLIANLSLQNPYLLRASAVRDNLSINIHYTDSTNVRIIYLLRLLKKYHLSKVIVYCQTRRITEQLAYLVISVSPYLKTLSYHAGLSAQERQQVEKDFHQHQASIIFATTAFGMGVDLPDIRAVIHYGSPASIEQYYQEIGRAGRDGLASRTYLLIHPSDSEVINSLGQSKNHLVESQNQQRFKALNQMVKSPICRMVMIAHYFGEKNVKCCEVCDRCTGLKSTHPLIELLHESREKEIISMLLMAKKQLQSSNKPDWLRLLTDTQLCWLAVAQPQSMGDISKITGFSFQLSDQLWPIIQSIMVK